MTPLHILGIVFGGGLGYGLSYMVRRAGAT